MRRAPDDHWSLEVSSFPEIEHFLRRKMFIELRTKLNALILFDLFIKPVNVLCYTANFLTVVTRSSFGLLSLLFVKHRNLLISYKTKEIPKKLLY